MATDDVLRYLNPELINRIGRLEMKARQVVEGYISGAHKSPFHGFSVEFASHREYVPGDEIKHIDWKLWARQDRFYVKQYEEETNLRCTLVLDCSRSMAYGSDPGSDTGKYACAAGVAASLAYLVHRQQDAVGLVLFDEAVRRRFEPSTSPAQLRTMMAHMCACEPDHGSDADQVFGELAHSVPKRGVVVLISDLFMPRETLRQALYQLRQRKQDVLVIQVLHDDEIDFPFEDQTLFRGLEAPGELQVDPQDLRRAYRGKIEQFMADVREVCARQGVDYLLVRSAGDTEAALTAYLLKRSHIGQRRARI
jgi:uncharacterized protein (DUF58 family)